MPTKISNRHCLLKYTVKEERESESERERERERMKRWIVSQICSPRKKPLLYVLFLLISFGVV